MQPMGPIKSVVATGETGAKKFSLAGKNVSYKSINLHSFIIYNNKNLVGFNLYFFEASQKPTNFKITMGSCIRGI